MISKTPLNDQVNAGAEDAPALSIWEFKTIFMIYIKITHRRDILKLLRGAWDTPSAKG